MACFSNKEIHVLIFASPKLAFAGPGLSARALNVAPSILTRGSHKQKRRQWDQGQLELTRSPKSSSVGSHEELGETRKEEVLLENSRGSAAQLTP